MPLQMINHNTIRVKTLDGLWSGSAFNSFNQKLNLFIRVFNSLD